MAKKRDKKEIEPVQVNRLKSEKDNLMAAPYLHLASDMADRLPRLTQTARHLSNTFLSGRHASGQSGTGSVFREYRPYQAGDSIKAIDWRRSARDDRPMLRLTERLSPHNVWLWVDKAPSMSVRYPDTTYNKFETGLIMALALADTVCRSGDRVGIPGVLHPINRRDIIPYLATRIVDAPDGPLKDNSLKSDDELFVFSDGLRWYEHPISHLSKDLAPVKGRFINIIHEIEATFPFTSSVNFVDPATGQHLRSHDVESWRAPYIARQNKLDNERKAFCRAQNWMLINMRPEWPLMPVMHGLYQCLVQASQGAAAQSWSA